MLWFDLPCTAEKRCSCSSSVSLQEAERERSMGGGEQTGYEAAKKILLLSLDPEAFVLVFPASLGLSTLTGCA